MKPKACEVSSVRSLARAATGALACAILCACTLPAGMPSSDYLGFVQEAMAEAARAESRRTHDAAAATQAVAVWREGRPAAAQGRPAGQANTQPMQVGR